MKSENGKDIARWMKAVDQITEEQAKAKTEKDKNDDLLLKNDEKIMQLKLDQLNRRIKKRYLEKDANMPEEKMFQFSFQDKGDYYEFTMPLNVLFGAKSRKFCADYWNEFFSESDIQTNFLDNIEVALKQAGNIMLSMKLNKALTKEKE